MSSPARRHYLRQSAAVSQAAESTTRKDANQYELMLAKLAEDRRRLHDVQSLERKIEIKRELLPDYAPWVEGVLSGNLGVQDDVLMTVMVWRIDTGDFSGALAIARYAIEHNLSMPDQYKRSTACLVAEEIADSYLRRPEDAPADDEAVQQLLAAIAATEAQDMPDEVRAKLYKAYGYSLRGTEPAAALEQLKRALALHERVGVKKDIEKLERELKNAGGE